MLRQPNKILRCESAVVPVARGWYRCLEVAIGAPLGADAPQWQHGGLGAMRSGICATLWPSQGSHCHCLANFCRSFASCPTVSISACLFCCPPVLSMWAHRCRIQGGKSELFVVTGTDQNGEPDALRRAVVTSSSCRNHDSRLSLTPFSPLLPGALITVFVPVLPPLPH